jgi:hypothetical protein
MDLTFEVARKFVKALNVKHQNVLKLEQTIGWKVRYEGYIVPY